MKAVNKSDMFTPAKGEEVSGCRRLLNKMGREKLLKVKRGVWFLCTARNALVIMISILIIFFLEPTRCMCHLTPGGCVLTLTGRINQGLPSWTLPTFLNYEDFSRMAVEHMAGAALIALIATLQNIAIAKSFGRRVIPAQYL